MTPNDTQRNGRELHIIRRIQFTVKCINFRVYFPFSQILKHSDFTQEDSASHAQLLNIENTLKYKKDILARFPPQTSHPWAFIIKLAMALTLNRWTQFYNINTNSMQPLLLEFQM